MSRLLPIAIALLVSTPALADDPKFEFGKSDEVAKVKDVEWNASAELGVVFTTGNSETTTVSGGAKASRKTGKNKLALEGSLTYARAGQRVLSDKNGNGMIDDASEIVSTATVTAETFAGKLRYDRFLTASNSLFVAALGSRDLPAGKEAVVGAQLGYSRQLLKSKKAEAVGEIGYDYSHEDPVTGDGLSIHSARAFLGYKAEMSEGATLDTSVEALTNLNEETNLITRGGKSAELGRDTRVNGKVGISAKIGKNLAVQAALEAKYDARPGALALKNLAMGFVPEATKLDTIMKASLIYTFF